MKHSPLRVSIIAALLLSLFCGRASAQYCTPGFFQGCTTSGQINDFSIAGASSSSISDPATGCSGTGGFPPVVAYLDHSTMTVSVNAATTYTVVASTTIGIVPVDIQIFIDFNNNFSFADAGESVGGGTLNALGTATNIPITIPAGATAGAHRMRAVSSGDVTYPSIDPCPSPPAPFGSGSAAVGEVHDYTAYVISATPTCPPITGLSVSAITSSSATANWTAATGAIGYEYAITTSSTPPASGTFTTTTTGTATGLTASTTYYAHVRTKCGTTTFSSWVTSTSFTTSAAPTTCDPVTGVTMSGITSGSATLNWAAVTGAIGYEWAATTSATPPASGTLTTLLTATASGLTASTPYYAHVRTKCSATLFSSWVTQTFTTTATSTCTAISGLTASGITTSAATVSWTAITTGSLGYQFVINNIVTDPVGSGTYTATATHNATGLTAATTYYAHVRDTCGPTSLSPWSTIPFTTLAAPGGCNAVTGLTATGITSNSATLNWTMASGAVGAKWVVDNTPADPTVSGTLSTTSTAAVSGLTASTTYYAHVRDTCGPTSLSAWVTIPFTTLGSVGITNISTGAAPFSVAAYPNPVNSELTIQVGGVISDAHLTLTDITGKVIRTMNIESYNTSIDVSALPPGIYIIRYTDGGFAQTLKVSKQ